MYESLDIATVTILISIRNFCKKQQSTVVDCVWNVMAHAQKPDFVFRRNGWVRLNRRWLQFSRLLAGEVCASAVVMLDTPCSEVVWRVLATHSIRQFARHLPCVPSHFNWIYSCTCAVGLQRFRSLVTTTELIYSQSLGMQSARLTPVLVRQQLRREQSVPRTLIFWHANHWRQGLPRNFVEVGGSTNSVEDRENGDLGGGAVAP